jgi:hypothetical protein
LLLFTLGMGGAFEAGLPITRSLEVGGRVVAPASKATNWLEISAKAMYGSYDVAGFLGGTISQIQSAK